MPNSYLFLLDPAPRLFVGQKRQGQNSLSARFAVRRGSGQVTIFLLLEQVGLDKSEKSVLTAIVDDLRGEFTRYFAASAPVIATSFLHSDLTAAQWCLDGLRQSIAAVNRRVYSQLRNRNATDTAFTLLVALLDGNHLWLAHLGNSRAYLLRANKLHCLTIDHTRVQELINVGKIRREQERTHPARTNLVRALGQQTEVEVDTRWLELSSQVHQPARNPALALHPGDCLILCTSAVADNLADQEMEKYVAGRLPTQLARRLVDQTGERGTEQAQVLALLYQPTLAHYGQRLLDLLLSAKSILLFLLIALLCGLFYFNPGDLQMHTGALINWLFTGGTDEPTAQESADEQLAQPATALATFTATSLSPPTLQPVVVATVGPRTAASTLPVAPPLPPTATAANTSTPFPSPTATPTLRPTAPGTPTLTGLTTATPITVTTAFTPILLTPTASPTVAATFTPALNLSATLSSSTPLLIRLLEPIDVVANVSGRTRFAWQADMSLPVGGALQIVYCRPELCSQPKARRGLTGYVTATEQQVIIDLPLLDGPDGLVPGTYRWMVCLVQKEPYKLQDECSTMHTFVYEREP